MMAQPLSSTMVRTVDEADDLACDHSNEPEPTRAAPVLSLVRANASLLIWLYR
jgi:hypothetical protein